ncbi:MAG: TlpA disulfide reductase family protein [Methyloprofundus sp.]|nr:TlpA disulfide reductase family protein [Methyloprofundus sp.]
MGWQRKLLLGFVGLMSIAPLQSAEVGQSLSECALSKLSNSQQPIEFSQFAGKVLYIDFWASWCPPCLKSFPFLNELHRHYHKDGLQIIGINLDEELEDAETFLREYPPEFTVASDLTKQCSQSLGVVAMPSSYLIDRNGIIRHIHLGFRSGETKALREKVQQLLAEQAL